jgi:multisubunit Na+/H+ antiporter MnhB subunit
MVYFTFYLFFIGANAFNPDKGVIMGLILPAAMVFFVIWLMYSTLRLRWAFVAFEVFDADTVSQIEARLRNIPVTGANAEQRGGG